MNNNSNYLSDFFFKCLKSWKSGELDVELQKEFCALNSDQVIEFIDVWIEEETIIKRINVLIRLKESIKTLCDNKLIFVTLKTIAENTYSDSSV